MANLRSDLPALLRAAGLEVVEVEGWRFRRHPGPFAPVGVLNHHTGASANGWSRAKELAYAKWMFLTGRPSDGLPAPLCQVALGRSGVVYVGAAGRANHAGTARASGTVAAGDGNTLYVGIEWMLSGTEKIPPVMMQSGVTLNAVICEKVTGNSVQTVSCHYNTSVTGKWDIGDPDGVPYKGNRVLNIVKFRAAVAAERERLYRPRPEPEPEKPVKKGRSLGVAVINVPIKVGRDAWEECFDLAAQSAVFGFNETLSAAQRAVYATKVAQHRRPLAHFGLTSPNPIFYREKRFRFVSGKVHQIHGKAPGPLAQEYPGYNAARYITELVLRQKADGTEFAFLNTHLVPNGKKVNPLWRAVVRRKSIKMLNELTQKHIDASRVVVVMGDMNIYEPFKMPARFRWYRPKGIDKIGGTRPGEAETFEAPTDHKRGVRAQISLKKPDKETQR